MGANEHITRTERKGNPMSNVATLRTGEQTFSLVPRSLDEAFKLAEVLANSDMVPKDYRGKPGNVLVAVQMGQELGLQPLGAIQNIAVVNGKPGLYGDAGKAILLANGCAIEEDDIRVIKDRGYATCTIIRNGRTTTRTYGIDNAKTAKLWGKEGPWSTNPERQMAWRAFWFAARDAAADLLKGLGGAEELRDMGPKDMGAAEVVATRPAAAAEPTAMPAYPADQFAANLPTWHASIAAEKVSAEQIITRVSSKYALSEEQKSEIRKQPEPGMFDKIKASLLNAQDADTLDVAADLLGEVEDETDRGELTRIYHERLAAIAG